jgi:hypothetical protein
MKVHSTLRMLAAAVLVLLAGCASAPAPRVAQSDAAGPASAIPTLDPTAKRRLPERPKGGDRARAIPNAKYNLESESDEKGPPTAAQFLRAHDQRKAVERRGVQALEKMAGIQPSQWQSLGPANVAGRVRAMAFDPRNPQRLLVGAATGGLWTSQDGGATWRVNSDFLPNLSITAIAFDLVNPSNVYIGTGEVSQGFAGIGVFKSTDGGNTFRFLEATNVDVNPDWRFVNRIAVSPTQPGVVLAAVLNNDFATGSIYRSADGGATWTRVFSGVAFDVAFAPDGAGAVTGTLDGYVAYSRDAGLSWTRTAPLATAAPGSFDGRVELAYARSQPSILYASVDASQGEVWRSSDGGVTWAKTATPGHLKAQGNYDNAIWVDPTDSNHVVVAGLDIWQSRDAGVTFAKVSEWTASPASPHADHHVLVSPPNFGAGSSSLYNGNDGGVYRADSVYNISAGEVGLGWSNMNNGLAITQFYSGAGTTAGGGRVIGGTQDNGSLSLRNGEWLPFRGGDGGVVAIDPTNEQYLYGEYVYLSIFRSVSGNFGVYICNGIADALPVTTSGTTGACGSGAAGKAHFIAPFILDPNNANRLLAGGASLWVNDNARASATWRAIKAASPVQANYINAIAVQEGNSNIAWVGHNNGELYKSSDATAGSPTWTRMGQGTLPARRINRILTNAGNANNVIVAFTGFVPNNLWQTLDGGATWSSVTGNHPDAPVFDLKRHPSNPNWLYSATSVGVFTSENAGKTWSTTSDGPANVRVRELFWIDPNTLGAATFGRGMFKVAVGASNMPNYQDLWWAGSAESGWGMSIAQHGSILFSAFFVYDQAGQPMWVVMPGGTWNASNTAFSGALYIPTGSPFNNYDASRFSAGSSVGNATITFNGLDSATLTYTINGVSGTKSISRQAFGAQDNTQSGSYGDLWWGGTSQNGWGVAINQQYRTLFAVWYTYDINGKTTWYVVPGGSWTATNVYTGTAYRTSGSAWLGVPFNASSISVQSVGSVTFTFNDASNGVMSYTIDGVPGSKPITRQPF